MRIGLSILIFALSACGARVDDNHTGGKTNWLSACGSDRDCNELPGALCATGVCTTSCETSCDIGGTTCAVLGTTEMADAAPLQVCLPECDDDEDCDSFGTSYECMSGVCAQNQGFNVGFTNVEAGAGDVLSVPDANFTNGSSDVSGETPQGSSPTSSSPPEHRRDGGQAEAADSSAENETSIAPNPGANDADGGNPPNPFNCPETIAAPSERPYLPQVLELNLDLLANEPGCEGPCGYRYWDDQWNFVSNLTCPLLGADACDEIRQAIAMYPAACNTEADCSRYTGGLTEGCEAIFVGTEHWMSDLQTPEERDTILDLEEQFYEGGCGTPRAPTGLTYIPVACTDGVCGFESVEQCD